MKKISFTLLVIFFVNSFSIAYSQSNLEERLKQHVYTLAADSLMGRAAGSIYSKKAADYIATQWKEIGINPLSGENYFIPFRREKYQNLAGIIKGNDPILQDEYIIIGAHYDHLGMKSINGETIIYNGADDNASGVAAIIELGRNLKSIEHTLRRSVILIAFDAEELGLYGSNEFINKPPFPVEKIKLMMSVDMVGWYKASGYVEYRGLETIKNGEAFILDTLLIPKGLNVKTKKFENSILTATDTEGFARKGVPTLAVTTGLKSPYHKPEDMAHLIDYEGLALITEHLTNVVKTVSQDNQFKSSGKVASKHRPQKRFTFGFFGNLGSNYHHYTDGALDGKSAFAAGVGFGGQLNIKYFGIRPEVYYDYVNARHPQGKITTHAITVPFNLILQTTSFAGIAIFAGPYYSYKFGGKQDNSNLDFKNSFNRDEIGINFGAEFVVGNFRIGGVMRREFSNFSRVKNADNAHIRNISGKFSFGYTF